MTLNKQHAKFYVNNILNLYKKIEHSRKEYIGFSVISNDIEVLREEGLRAKDNLHRISEIYCKLSLADTKIFIFSYILVPLVCSKILPEFYLARFHDNIASCNNLVNIKTYVNDILNNII